MESLLVNLTLITLIQLEIFPPKAFANEINTTTAPTNTNYGLVPLNEDGSIDVNINSSSAIMDVNIYKINNEFLKYGGGAVLPVEIIGGELDAHCYVMGEYIMEWTPMYSNRK